MKKSLSIFLTLFLTTVAATQNTPKISLLTYETGVEAYSIFGHTALRVQNFNEGTDVVYNFGLFDFNTSNFLLKFAGGRLDYRLGINSFEQMLRSYQHENRQVYEQSLNISPKQSVKIEEKLAFLYRPENRYYRYGFLQRNCSTELRDLLLEEVDDAKYTPLATNKTYRSYLNNYSKVNPWFKFGINLALGSTIDTKINTYQLMFLPNFLSKELEKATVKTESLANSKKSLLKNLSAKKPLKWQLTPFILCCFLFVLLILGRSRFLIQTFTLIVASIGVIILATTLFSAHPEVQKNYNLLWCNPLYFISFILCFTQFKKFHRIFAAIMLLGILLMFGVWFFKIQGYDLAFIPICASLFWINLKQIQRK